MTKLNEFFCLCCKARFDSDEDFNKHGCNPMFKMARGIITVELSEIIQLKRTRWGRFCEKFWSIDWGWGLAFMGLLIMNMVLTRHMNLTFSEAIVEGLALGFAIPRLIK